MWSLGLWLVASAVSVAARFEGRLSRNDIDLHYSWWLSADDSRPLEWKSSQLGFETVKGTVTKLEDQRNWSDLVTRPISVDQSGVFAVDFTEGPGEYLIRFNHLGYVFPEVLAVVDQDESYRVFKVNPALGIKRGLNPMRSIVGAVAIQSPYKDPEPFNPWKVFKNPMAIMLAVMFVVSYGLPWLTDGMDIQKIREDMAREQGGSGAATGPEFQGSFVKNIRSNQRTLLH